MAGQYPSYPSSGDYYSPQPYASGPQSHGYPSQNPYAASEVSLHAPGAIYPPAPSPTGMYEAKHDGSSQWSLDDEPLTAAAAPAAGTAAGAGYDSIAREKDNPFSADYQKKAGNGVQNGVAVGIAVWRVKANDSSSGSSTGTGKSSSSSSLQYINGTAKVVKSNPNDPSDFEKDDRLKPIFYGLAYTPYNALEPWCGATLQNVTEDIQLMSQLTTRLRTYGSACNQTQLLLQAIQDTKVNMTVWIGAYIGTNTTVNAQQQQMIIDAINIYGTDHISGITIGNECFRTQLDALKLPKTLPVGTADAGSVFTTALADGSDYIMANVHPWFGGVPIDQAAGWTWEYFTENDVAVAAKSKTPSGGAVTSYIAETGWPTASMTPENATLGAAVSGVPELQTFIDTYPCQANANNSHYFYFEPWKEEYGGVEPYWGLFDYNKILKNITFPDCAVGSANAAG
ncbi:SPOSA6832_02916 [Sporobolomyces salmonicolor]|uniref:glucan endo-1,3-beta-D-glucosidase n=1 Tax=Sporidiobolus salmonicolor TaxID=5005 RepID=A0A0D6EMX5_SPOSA|nr:SPOSA6832_02916 [Sporobolomyces salmonicolor]